MFKPCSLRFKVTDIYVATCVYYHLVDIKWNDKPQVFVRDSSTISFVPLKYVLISLFLYHTARVSATYILKTRNFMFENMYFLVF